LSSAATPTQAAESPLAGGTPVASLGSLILLTLRVLLGGIFCFAATLKLLDPQSFSEAIQAFRTFQSDELVLMGTHTLPWVEMFAGAALMLGLWTREAALIIAMLLLVFIGVIVNAIHLGLEGIPCSCFGYWHLICRGGVGWCKVWENSGLTAIAAGLAFAGGGKLALERVCFCGMAQQGA